tara:strand:- start:240 stop:659 length:420 start_codon:yes stop_codon:yes gene_type:complete
MQSERTLSGDRRQETEDRRKAPARIFQDLLVWQKGHQLVLSIYRLTTDFPRTEVYGLTQQLRRAAVSVPANVAEGFKRRSKAEKARFLNISQSSLEEVRYYLILASDLGYADTASELADLDEVGRMLSAYGRLVETPHD